MKTVILGLGNPLLHDDGAGIEVVKRLEGTAGADCDLKTASVGGLRILDQITGYDRAIIVDAIITGAKPGTVRRMCLAELSGELHASCIHDLNLKEALDLGHFMGMPLPERITIYGIEVEDPYLLKEGCSEEVLRGVEEAVRLITADLKASLHHLVEELHSPQA